jgi:hypothetical protein
MENIQKETEISYKITNTETQLHNVSADHHSQQIKTHYDNSVEKRIKILTTIHFQSL